MKHDTSTLGTLTWRQWKGQSVLCLTIVKDANDGLGICFLYRHWRRGGGGLSTLVEVM